jgi:membrane protein DedA with SNARE-associated domain
VADWLGALEGFQYGLLALIIGLQAGGVPWPVASEFVVVVMGYQVFRELANPAVVMVIIVASGTVGAVALYGAGRLLGRPLVDRHGRWLRMRPERVARLERRFGRRCLLVVILGRMIPGVWTPVAAIAGVARVRFSVFVRSAIIGNTLWAALYVGLGWGFGDQFEATVAAVMGNPAVVAAAAGGTAVAIVTAGGVRFRRPLARLVATALPGA